MPDSAQTAVPAAGVLDSLDAADVHRWSRCAVERLEAGRDDIDALNVFPVPDGDTGTNMLATLLAAQHSLDDALAVDAPVDPSRPAVHAADALQALSRGAALGAIGNSGFILSQVLRGLAEAADPLDGWGAEALGAGLAAGARLGRQAVVTPVEGTILSVAGAAAAAAARVLDAGGASLAAVVRAVVDAAGAAVARTPAQLPDLAEAGVVDAGGRGLLVVLDALARVVGGDVPDLAPVHVPSRRPGTADDGGDDGGDDAADLAFEVQYLLELPGRPSGSRPSETLDELRAALARVGDSVAVVPTDPAGPGAGTGKVAGTWKVHVHVDDVGAAIEAGIEAGRPRGIEVSDLRPSRVGERPAALRRVRRVAVVAVAPGEGLAHLFAGEGVHVCEGQPGVDDVVAVIHDTRARDVVLLPNASRIAGVAEAAATRVRAEGVRVTVVPTRSPVQGLAAVAVHDAGRRFDDDVVAMAEAAAATRFAELAVARSRALTAVGVCDEGDVLGLIDGEVVEIGRGLLAVAFGLVDRLLGVGAELMTVLVGEGAPRRTGELIEAHVRGRAPLTDVTVYHGGHPDHPVIIGVE